MLLKTIANNNISWWAMNEYLTARQVQDLLKIDRTSIYRMLKDGRLTGIKVGSQWRFPRKEIETLLSDQHLIQEKRSGNPAVLPIHCIQIIQDVFADMAELGAVTTDRDGTPLTEVSNSCRFCSMILSSDSGRKACIESWRQLAKDPEMGPEFIRCHAGLAYARSCIKVNGLPSAMIVAGQFYSRKPDEDERMNRLNDLAARYDLDPELLLQEANEIRALTPENGRKN